MASVDETVEKVIFNYPSLFANRTQVLHHLFVVFGNGFAWRDGELVDCFDEPDLSDAEVLHVLPERFTVPNPEEPEPLQALARETAARQEADHAEFLRRRRHAKTLARTPGPLTGRVCPPSEKHAFVFDYPSDIRPDWEAARLEILAVVEPLWAAGEHLVEPRPQPTPLAPEAAALLKRLWDQTST